MRAVYFGVAMMAFMHLYLKYVPLPYSSLTPALHPLPLLSKWDTPL